MSIAQCHPNLVLFGLSPLFYKLVPWLVPTSYHSQTAKPGKVELLLVIYSINSTGCSLDPSLSHNNKNFGPSLIFLTVLFHELAALYTAAMSLSAYPNRLAFLYNSFAADATYNGCSTLSPNNSAKRKSFC